MAINRSKLAAASSGQCTGLIQVRRSGIEVGVRGVQAAAHGTRAVCGVEVWTEVEREGVGATAECCRAQSAVLVGCWVVVDSAAVGTADVIAVSCQGGSPGGERMEGGRGATEGAPCKLRACEGGRGALEVDLRVCPHRTHRVVAERTTLIAVSIPSYVERCCTRRRPFADATQKRVGPYKATLTI